MGVLYQPIEELEEEMVKAAIAHQHYLKQYDNSKQTDTEEVLRKRVRDILDKKPKLD